LWYTVNLPTTENFMSPTIQIRLPDELKAELQALANQEGRTLSNLVRRLLEQALQAQKSEASK